MSGCSSCLRPETHRQHRITNTSTIRSADSTAWPSALLRGAFQNFSFVPFDDVQRVRTMWPIYSTWNGSSMTAPCVALLLSGPATRHSNPDIDSAQQLRAHVIEPLLSDFTVGVFVAAENVANWKHAHLRKLRASTTAVVVATEVPPLPPRAISRFRDKHQWAGVVSPELADVVQSRVVTSVWLQWGHVLQAFELMELFERLASATFSFVLKCRIDLFYKPDHYFAAAWLRHMPNGTIATSSTEFECLDRWVDRTNSRPTYCFAPPDARAVKLGETWPFMIPDQFLFGRRDQMKLVLRGFFYSKPTRDRHKPPWHSWPSYLTSEFALAEHIDSIGLEPPVAFELQFRSVDRLRPCPSPRCPVLPANHSGLWVKGRCVRCYFDQCECGRGR